MQYVFTVVVVIATLFTFSSLTHSNALDRRGQRSKPALDLGTVALTRLRAGQPVVVQQISRGSRQVRHANVEVMNVGSVAATGVQVALEQPGGVAYALRGPKNLLPRERALYILNSRAVAGPGSLHVVIRCSNCRR